MKRSRLRRRTPLRRSRAPRVVPDPAWMRARQACRDTVMDRAGGRCEATAFVALVDPCQARLCHRWASDVHELKRRSQGGDPTNPDHCIAICRPCHMWVTGHPQLAHRVGLARWGWESPQRSERPGGGLQ